MNLGLTIPTRERSKKIERLTQSIQNGLKTKTHKVTICLGLDQSDPTIKEYLDVIERNTSEQISFHITYFNEWNGLANAFNIIAKNLPDNVETISMFGDDMIMPQSEEVINLVDDFLNKQCSPDHIGAIWFNDGTPVNFNTPDPIAINGFVHRNWFEALGYFVPNEFLGDYSDNWLSEVARGINRFSIIREVTILHLHFTFDSNETDSTAINKMRREYSVGYHGESVWKKQKLLIPKIVEKLNKYIMDYSL